MTSRQAPPPQIAEGAYRQFGEYLVERQPQGDCVFAAQSRLAGGSVRAVLRDGDNIYLLAGNSPFCIRADGLVWPYTLSNEREQDRRLQELAQYVPLSDQIAQAGFRGAPGSSSLVERRSARGKDVVLVIDGNNRISSVYIGDDTFTRSFPGARATGEVVPAPPPRQRLPDEEHAPGLRMQCDGAEFVLRRDIGGGLLARSVRIIDDLSQEQHARQTRTDTGGLVINGMTDPAVIRALPSVNGVAIDELITDMQPGALSRIGFTGKGEDPRIMWARDEEVLRRAGMTHHDLASALRAVADQSKNNRFQNTYGQFVVGENEFSMNGASYRASVNRFKGGMGQASPFRDGIYGAEDIGVLNVASSKSVNVPVLNIELIDRYGFHQGAGTTARTSPESIIETFDHLLVRAPEIARIAAEVDAEFGITYPTTERMRSNPGGFDER